jgi:hypothetical protein
MRGEDLSQSVDARPTDCLCAPKDGDRMNITNFWHNPLLVLLERIFAKVIVCILNINAIPPLVFTMHGVLNEGMGIEWYQQYPMRSSNLSGIHIVL